MCGQTRCPRIFTSYFVFLQDRSSSLERERRGSQEVIEEKPEEEDQKAEKETAKLPGEEAQPEHSDTPFRESTLDDEMAVFARTPFFEYPGHTADVLDVSWSKNYFILSSSMDKTVRLWHISRNECLCCFQHIDFVTAIAFHPRVSNSMRQLEHMTSACFHKNTVINLWMSHLSYVDLYFRIMFFFVINGLVSY